MAQCGACGTVQLAQPPPIEELLAVPPWMTYNEPDRHLDALAAHIALLPSLAGTTAVGVGVHDEPLLARLAARGFDTSRLDTSRDLGIDSPVPGPAAIQQRLTPARARAVVKTRGRAPLVIARYTYEHAYDPVEHLCALEELAAPEGMVLLELPDCTDALRTMDYTTLWEEHVLYHTPQSLRAALTATGWHVVWMQSYPNTLHNALVVIVTRARTPGASAASIEPSRQLATTFAEAFPVVRGRVQQWFEGRRATGVRVALLGAGHLGVTYLTIMSIAGHVEFAVDDNPQKQGFTLPGVRLPIRPSSALLDEQIGITLMAVNPDSEAAVLTRIEPFHRGGGQVASIFPTSPYALPVY